MVGLACRLPNANSVQEFWESLKAGMGTVGEVKILNGTKLEKHDE